MTSVEQKQSEWDMALICKDCLLIIINSLRLRQDRRHFADDTFKCIFLNENEWISLRISLKFFPKVGINNIPSLVQIMAWRRPGDKPLSEPMVVSSPTHICVTRPQWVNQFIMSPSCKKWINVWAIMMNYLCTQLSVILLFISPPQSISYSPYKQHNWWFLTGFHNDWGAWDLRTSASMRMPYHLFIVEPFFRGLVQERCNSSALAMDLRLSCIDPLN